MNVETRERSASEAENGAAVLDDEQATHFRRHGWVLVPKFFDASQARLQQRWADELAALPERPGEQMVYREQSLIDPAASVVQRIEYFCKAHAGFDGLLNRGRLQEACSQLLGETALLFKEKINFKYPGGAGFEAHQDQQAGWSVYAPVFVSALIAIDDATVDNGCLELELDRAERLAGLIGEEWKPLSEGIHAEFLYKPVPTAPGDVIFFDSYVPHRSNPNLTASARRILYATYNGRSHGDHREQYFHDKRLSFPPDCEREAGKTYKFRV